MTPPTTVQPADPPTPFPRTFWTANLTELFERAEEATPMKVEAKNRSIYGIIPEAEEGEE